MTGNQHNFGLRFAQSLAFRQRVSYYSTGTTAGGGSGSSGSGGGGDATDNTLALQHVGTIASESEQVTRELGKKIAHLCKRGDVVCLVG